MIRVIQTNIGDFARFSDVETEMRISKIEKVKIINVVMSDGARLFKNIQLSYAEIISLQK